MSTVARSFGGGCAFAARAFGQSIGNRPAAFERDAAVERDPAGAFSRGAAAGAHSHASVSSIFARGAFRNAMIFAARPRIYFRERPMWTCVKFRVTPIPARFGERTLFLSGSGAYWAMTSRDFRGGAMGD
ncbi:hypothetical protein [Burkholderia pseudomallei]|uniref:hypothetical protein n=1 Tax=Burkholderia pseudomallei TaxID=28450 RepID=UPI002181E251|nr:hypothetical protein [Burkholderia pseudomallei]